MVHEMYSAPNYPKCTTRLAEASLRAYPVVTHTHYI